MRTELIGDQHAPEEHEQIGPYRLLQQVGEGGMGVVHLALDPRGKAVALKVLRPHVAHDEDARARLGREVEILGRVRSPRVAPIFDADLDAPAPYIVTRYVPGPSLDAAVREDGPMAPDALLRLARGLTEALSAIHAVGVVHRDLKPGNVLLLDGDPVVIDFGIAHAADASRMTMTGLVMGTPGYLSPEIVEGGDVGVETDWWGWAATLAFAATGRPPFGRGGMEAVLARVCRGDADLRGVDPALAPLLSAALDPDPSARPSSAQVMAALEAYAHGRPVTEVLPQRSPRTQTQPQPPNPAAPPAASPAATQRLAPATAAAPPPARPHAPQQGPQQAPLAQPVAPQTAPAQAGSSAWSPHPGHHVDPRAALPQRSDVLAALLVVMTALAAALPYLALTLAVLWSVLARTVDRATTATVRRRHRSGARRSDVPLAVLASPWHAVIASLATVVAVLLPLLVGAGALVAAAVAQGYVDGLGVRLSTPVPLAAGGLVALLTGWFGPAAPSLRRGSRSLVRGVTGTEPARRGLVLALAVLALGLAVGLLTGALDVSWWPSTTSPLPDPTRLPGR